MRSRLVAQDFNHTKGKQGPDEFFAATPPLIAARYSVSRSASCSDFPRRLRWRLMTIDFEKAFLNGLVLREVCIVLPAEDGRSRGGENVGYLKPPCTGSAKPRSYGRIWSGTL